MHKKIIQLTKCDACHQKIAIDEKTRRINGMTLHTSQECLDLYSKIWESRTHLQRKEEK